MICVTARQDLCPWVYDVETPRSIILKFETEMNTKVNEHEWRIKVLTAYTVIDNIQFQVDLI
jgi:hypothetical protein